MKEIKSLKIKSLTALEKWLEKNFDRHQSIWLVYPKPSTGLSDVSYTKLVDVLLCYGWVDSLPRKVDETWTSIRISPRNPKSNWSKINKDKIKRLEKEGKLKPPGKKLIQIAKKYGTWDALNAVEKLILPDDFKKALNTAKLLAKWEEKSHTFKRGYLEQLFNSKKQETRDKKILKIIQELK